MRQSGQQGCGIRAKEDAEALVAEVKEAVGAKLLARARRQQVNIGAHRAKRDKARRAREHNRSWWSGG